jgi:hypothetical protein
VAKALKDYRGHDNIAQANSVQEKPLRTWVARIEVRTNQLAVWLRQPGAVEAEREARPTSPEQKPAFLISWTKPPSKRLKEILVPASSSRACVRPIKVERRAALLKSIARGRAWLEEVVSGSRVDDIAARRKCSIRQVNMTISMAFIAPALVKAAVEGRLPRGIGVAGLRDSPAEWSLQFARLGLAQP